MQQVTAKQPPETIVNASGLSEASSVLQQSAILPMTGLPGDYQMHRVLSVDTSKLPSEQVLQISYQVLYKPAPVEAGDSDTPPPTTPVSSEASVAQLHAAILPNAALVCF
jgi:hypothetical protein